VASDAARAALDAFRDKPNRIGRARMFADKTIGMDDPGMVALLRMVDAL
jgi:dihydroxyacetone kinase-like protein